MFPKALFTSAAALGVLSQTACTTARVRSIDDLPKDRGQMVHVEAVNWNILMNGTNNGFNEQVLEKLNKARPNRPVKVSMVESRYTFVLPDFLYKEKVSAYGYCDNPG